MPEGGETRRKKQSDGQDRKKTGLDKRSSDGRKGRSDRVFYETLLKQKPDSHMAQDWCLAYGIFSWEDAHSLYIKICKRKEIQPSLYSPPESVSSPSKVKKAAPGGGGKARRRKSEVDDDTGFEAGNAFEGVGTMGL